MDDELMDKMDILSHPLNLLDNFADAFPGKFVELIKDLFPIQRPIDR